MLPDSSQNSDLTTILTSAYDLIMRWCPEINILNIGLFIVTHHFSVILLGGNVAKNWDDDQIECD